MSKKIKVTMELTDKDVKNSEMLTKMLDCRSKAASVSSALSIATSIIKFIKDGKELLVKSKSGKMEKILIAGI